MKFNHKLLIGAVLVFGPLIAALLYTHHPIWAAFTWGVGLLIIAPSTKQEKEGN